MRQLAACCSCVGALQENRLLPPEAYVQSETYGNLQGLLEDTFLNYMVRMHASQPPAA